VFSLNPTGFGQGQVQALTSQWRKSRQRGGDLEVTLLGHHLERKTAQFIFSPAGFVGIVIEVLKMTVSERAAAIG
jgi:hypothetical protein